MFECVVLERCPEHSSAEFVLVGELNRYNRDDLAELSDEKFRCPGDDQRADRQENSIGELPQCDRGDVIEAGDAGDELGIASGEAGARVVGDAGVLQQIRGGDVALADEWVVRGDGATIRSWNRC